MEVGADIWVKNRLYQNPATDDLWTASTIRTKEPIVENYFKVSVLVDGSEESFSIENGSNELADLKLRNSAFVAGTVENLIDLPYLNEPEILFSLKNRYSHNLIYTLTGPVLIAINPFDEIAPDESCDSLLEQYCERIKKDASGTNSFAITNLFSSDDGGALINATTTHSHSILISGESGSGKTECSKLLLRHLANSSSNRHQQSARDRTTPDGLQSKNRPRTPSASSAESVEHLSTPVSNKKGAMKDESNSTAASQLSIVSNIMVATPIIEAFGNAQTVSTHNSSRFGKHVELCMNSEGSLIGGAFRSYLLESVRVTSQQTGERNFHIFYQLIAGATSDERARYHIANSAVESYRLINQGLTNEAGNVRSIGSDQDSSDFASLKAHLASLSCSAEDVDILVQIVAGLLHLGNVEFNATNDLTGEGSEVRSDCESSGNDNSSSSAVKFTAELFSLSASDLVQTLTVRSMTSRGETFQKRLTVAQASNARDALAKAIYKRAFDWVVGEVNSKIRVSHDDEDDVCSRIAILDIFGFDAFRVNSFEQLCINYANELLQQQFNQQVFKLEQLEYSREGILVERVDFEDNQDTVDLIQGVLFRTLDDQCKLPNPTDKRFAHQLYVNCKDHSRFSANQKQQRDGMFCVQHFAGTVMYSTDNFIEKNLDELPVDAVNLLAGSGNRILRFASTAAFVENDAAGHGTSMRDLNALQSMALSSPAGAASRRGASRTQPSAVAQFRNELNVMIKQINGTVPHYIRCINPRGRGTGLDQAQLATTPFSSPVKARNVANINDATSCVNVQSSTHFHQLRVAEQLRSGGVLEAVRVTRSGYPIRLSHIEFYCRYRYLASPLHSLTVSLPVSLSRDQRKAGSSDAVKTLCQQLIITLDRSCSTSISDSVVGSADGTNRVDLMSKVNTCVSIATGSIQVGLTKVFLKKADHALLESALYAIHKYAGDRINAFCLHRAVRLRYLRVIRGACILQRVVRGGVVRIRTRKEKAARAMAAELARQQQEAERIAAKVKAAEEAATLQAQRDKEQALQQLADQKTRAEQAAEDSRHLELLHKVRGVTAAGTEAIAAKVAEYRELDMVLLNEINMLISQKKVTDEDSILRFDIERARKLLREWIAYLQGDSVLADRVTEVVDSVDYGYNMLLTEKLIPMTVFGKAFSLGRHVQSTDRTSSVKYASKSVTKEHKVFKNIFRILELIKEVLEVCKADRLEIDHKKKRLSSAAAGTPSKSGQQTLASKEVARLETLLVYTSKISDFSKILYTYYYQYIMHVVAEFGEGSAYKAGFPDDNQYLLALATLMDQKRPLLDCERRELSRSKKAGSGLDEEANTFFPITTTATKLSRTGRNTTDKIFFKAIPFAPGVEFAVNSLNLLLTGELLMYPIRFIKLVGKSAANYNQVAYYQASTRLCEATLHTVLREPQYVQCIENDSFSATLVTMLLLGATNVQPDNFMLKVTRANSMAMSLDRMGEDTQDSDTRSAGRSQSAQLSRGVSMVDMGDDAITSIALQGINNDAIFTDGLFNYEKIRNMDRMIEKLQRKEKSNINKEKKDDNGDSASSNGSLEGHLNIMLFLPQMQLPVSLKMRTLLTCSRGAVEELVSNWLRELYLQNKRYEYLKQSGFSVDDLNCLRLPIKLPVGAAVEVYTQLQQLRDFLQSAPDALNVHMLTAIHPTLAAYYDALKNNESGALSQYKSSPISSLSNTHDMSIPQTQQNDRIQKHFTETVERTASAFIREVDLSQFVAEEDLSVCKILSDNLSFLSVLHLHRASELQLYAMFGSQIDKIGAAKSTMGGGGGNGDQSNTPNKGLTSLPSTYKMVATRSLVLTGLSREEKETWLARSSKIILSLHAVLDISVHFDSEGSPSLVEMMSAAGGRQLSVETVPHSSADTIGVTSSAPVRVSLKRVDSIRSDSPYGKVTSASMDSPAGSVKSPSREELLIRSRSQDDTTIECLPSLDDTEIKRKLQYLLSNYANLTHHKSLTEMSAEIAVIKELVQQCCSGQPVSIALVEKFGKILVSFPGLSNLAKDIAQRGLFAGNRTLLQALITHDQVDRYSDIILCILHQTPELLYGKFHNQKDARSGSAQVLPCDHVRSLPDNKSFKFRMLAAMINCGAGNNAVHSTLWGDGVTYDSLPDTATGSGWKASNGEIRRLFTQYHGEEELIARAASYGFPATPDELHDRQYRLEKCMEMHGIEETLLHAIARVSHMDLPNATLHRENLDTFRLVVEVLRSRVKAGKLGAENASAYFYGMENSAGETVHSIVSGGGGSNEGSEQSEYFVNYLNEELLRIGAGRNAIQW